MKLTWKLAGGLFVAAKLAAGAANAHTNSVGFQVTTSAITTCVGSAATTCYDVEVFYGSWHSGTITPQGQLALFFQNSGGGETQVVGPSASGGSATPFSMSHSLTGTIPNGLPYSTTNSYSVVGSAAHNNLITVFTPGTDYFYNVGSGPLSGTPTSSTNGVYNHQSAIGRALGPGTYRIGYDTISPPSSATWTPQPSVQTATFTITDDGGVVVDTGGAPNVSVSGPTDPVSAPFTVTATFSEDVTGVELSDFVIVDGTATSLVQVAPNVYTVTVTPTPGASGPITVTMPADAAIDSDSNGNTVSNVYSVEILVAPDVAVTGPAGPVSDPFTVTATFSEDVTGVELSDFVVADGTAASLVQVSADTYTISVTPTPGATGPVTVTVPAAAAIDSDSNPNTVSNVFSVPIEQAPSVALTGPAGPVVDPFTVTATFSEDVTGVELSDFVIVDGTAASLVQVSPDTYAITVTPDWNAPGPLTVTVPAASAIDGDSNPNIASNIYSVGIAPPTTISDEQAEEITAVVVEEELKTLRAQLSINQRMTRNARGRFLAQQKCRDIDDEDRLRDPELALECEDITKSVIPFDITGIASITKQRAHMRGSFFEQIGTINGDSRRLFFGEFEVTDDEDIGLIATLDGRVAWERMIDDATLFGYFIGAEVAQSNIEGTYTGDRDRIGVSAGIYGVRDLEDGLALDGFASLALGQNQLDMTDGVLDVDADYFSKSIQFGGALSGMKEYENFDLHPELAFAYGYSNIGTVDFDATAIGFASSDSLDGGGLSIGVVSFTPEILIPMGEKNGVYNSRELRIAPSVQCEFIDATVDEQGCGGAFEVELSAHSDDGLRTFSARLRTERIGSSTRNSVALTLDHRF